MMKIKPVSYFLVVFSIILSVHADQFIVVKAPKSLEFKSDSDILADNIQDVFSASLGYSVPTTMDSSNWDGFRVNDPFNVAEGLVSVIVDGLDSLDVKGGKSFNIYGRGDPVTSTLDEIHRHDGTSVDLDLKSDVGKTLETVFGVIVPRNAPKTHFLKSKSNKPAQDFLNQIAMINGLSDMLADNKNHVPTATVIRLSLSEILKENEHDSAAFNEALKILKNAMDELTMSAEKAYKNKALITMIVVSETVHSRVRRAVGDENKDYNLAESYDENYPVIFNIIFWFSFIMIFSLLAISLAIGNMDPGRDSIIYRMTSTRMKKDN